MVEKEKNNINSTEEEQIKEALLSRPGFTIKSRLSLMLLLLVIVCLTITIIGIFMISKIDDRMNYIFYADKISNEIQFARRIEKNYLLYHSNLQEIKTHINNASQLLETTYKEFGNVVGLKELSSLKNYLAKYNEIANDLITNYPKGSNKSKEFIDKTKKFRNFGAKILELSLDITKKERKLVAKTINRAIYIQAFLILIILIFSIYIYLNITKHIIIRLNKLVDATKKLAEGNFIPITPMRKYKDEFSFLAIAFNHMMYEIKKRQDLLIESHKLRAIGNLTAGIAHELNNPLNNIIITTEMLKEDFTTLDDDTKKDMINDIVEQGERARQIVKNLLDYARESKTKAEYFFIDNLISNISKLIKNQIKISGLKFEVEIPPNLPPIYGDINLLTQAFINICLNSIDAMSKEGTLSIKVREEKNLGFMEIQISDTGVGIPEHLIKSIFNPFFTTKPQGKGTGLGLSVTQGIIEKHGGEIEVFSKVNKGTTFIVHLPIVPIPADIKNK